MKILVFSDTHHNTDFMVKALREHMADTDLIIHLGDNVCDTDVIGSICPHTALIRVLGNCDLFGFCSDVPAEGFVPLGKTGVVAFVCHGHRYGVNDGTDVLVSKAKSGGAKIALYGHTHVAEIACDRGVYVLNPGSATLPRSAEPRSYGILRIDDKGEITPTVVYDRKKEN